MLQIFIVPFYIPRKHISGISRQDTLAWTRYCCFMNHFKVLKLKTTIIFRVLQGFLEVGCFRLNWWAIWWAYSFMLGDHSVPHISHPPLGTIKVSQPCPHHGEMKQKDQRTSRNTRDLSRPKLRTTTLSLPASCIDPSKSHDQAQSQSGRAL